MRCYICGAVAQTWDFVNGGKSVDCVKCSRYDITGSLLQVRRRNDDRFDVEQTRAWLQAERDIGHSPPVIRSGTEKRALQSGR